MASYNYVVNGRRFVRQVRSVIPTPVTSTVSEAAAVLEQLQRVGAWREIADMNVRAALPLTGEVGTSVNLTNMDFFDAYNFRANLSNNQHVLYMGAGCYRLSFPQAIAGATLKSIKTMLFGDVFLADGARMVVRTSDSPTPDASWANVSASDAQISGAVTHTEESAATPQCPLCVTWRARSGTYTLNKDETKGDGSIAVFPSGGIVLRRFLYIYVSLENYERVRMGFTEGAAMSNGVFNLAVEGTGLPPSGTLEEEPVPPGLVDTHPPDEGFVGWFFADGEFEFIPIYEEFVPFRNILFTLHKDLNNVWRMTQTGGNWVQGADWFKFTGSQTGFNITSVWDIPIMTVTIMEGDGLNKGRIAVKVEDGPPSSHVPAQLIFPPFAPPLPPEPPEGEFVSWFNKDSVFEAVIASAGGTQDTWQFKLMDQGFGFWSAQGSPHPQNWNVFNTIPPEGVTTRIVFQWTETVSAVEVYENRIFFDILAEKGINAGYVSVKVTLPMGRDYGRIIFPDTVTPPLPVLPPPPPAGVPALPPLPDGFDGWYPADKSFQTVWQGKTRFFMLKSFIAPAGGPAAGQRHWAAFPDNDDWSPGGISGAYTIANPSDAMSRIDFRLIVGGTTVSRVLVDIISDTVQGVEMVALRLLYLDQYGTGFKILTPPKIVPDYPPILPPAVPGVEPRATVLQTNESLLSGRILDCTSDTLPQNNLFTEMVMTQMMVIGLNDPPTDRDYERMSQQLLMWHGRSKKVGDSNNICIGGTLSGPTGLLVMDGTRWTGTIPSNFGLMAFMTQIDSALIPPTGASTKYNIASYFTSYTFGWIPPGKTYSKVVIGDLTGTTVPSTVKCQITAWFLPKSSLTSANVGGHIRSNYALTPEFWSGGTANIGGLVRLGEPFQLPASIPAEITFKANTPFKDGVVILTANLMSPITDKNNRGFKATITQATSYITPEDGSVRYRVPHTEASTPKVGWTPSIYVEG